MSNAIAENMGPRLPGDWISLNGEDIARLAQVVRVVSYVSLKYLDATSNPNDKLAHGTYMLEMMQTGNTAIFFNPRLMSCEPLSIDN